MNATATAPDAPAPRDDAVWDLSDQLVRTVKILVQARERLANREGLDRGAYPLMALLATEPRRVSDLAEAVRSDISTVSRLTSALVKRGLAEKITDDADRRVQLVSLTPAGHAHTARCRDERRAWTGRVLAGWSPADVETFRTHLQRFADDIETTIDDLQTDSPPGTDAGIHPDGPTARHRA